MKKAIITAALFAVVAVTPSFTCVLGAIDVPDRASGFAGAAASPIFWHLYDELLTRALARVTEQSATLPSARPESAICSLVQIVMSRAIDGSLATAPESQSMSISGSLIRRVIEHRFAAVHTAQTLRHS